MSYGICRVQKVKSSGTGGMQYHNDRMPGRHSNADIDPEWTRFNYELRRHGSYASEVQGRIDRYRESDRKVRKDAVVMVEGIVTASPEWFEGRSADEIRAFFEDSFEFVKEWMGDENVIHFTVHLDETTPHAHWGATPIKDGKLSWKKFFDGRDALRAFQDAFYERVGSRNGMERGERDTGRKHKDLQEMKRDSQREVRELAAAVGERRDELRSVSRLVAESSRASMELDEDIAYKEGVLCGLDGEIESKESVLSDLDRLAAETRAEIERETARLESLRLRARAVEKDVEQLGAVHALTAEYERSPRGRKGEILSQIADCCNTVRNGLEARWKAVREAVARVLRPVRDVPSTARLMDALREREAGIDLNAACDIARAASAAMSAGRASQGRSVSRGR